jgi:gluconolactonase
MKRSSLHLLFVAVTLLMAVTICAQEAGTVVRRDPALDAIISVDAHLEKVADGFDFLEGPVWVRKGSYLLFNDVAANAIYKWTSDRKVSVFLEASGFTGSDPSGVGREIDNGRKKVKVMGSGAVTLDRQGRIVFCAQGDRNVARIEKDGRRTVLADRFEGKRLNSPNDLVYKSDGSLYFTDPPAALPKGDDDPGKELPFDGVFLLKDGNLTVLDKTFSRPNGLAFAPGEKQFYVNDSLKKTIMRFDVRPDDTIANRQVLIDMSADNAPGAPDGMKVDRKGNVYCTGPGGLWIISPQGKHLGTIRTPERITNLAFGNADGKALYITSRTGELYRIELKVAGIRP